MNCAKCNEPMRPRTLGEAGFVALAANMAGRLEEFQTLVGYSSPEGHDHDDNCLTRVYICPNGHTLKIGKRRRCPACDWVGQESCGCHEGLKVDEWP